MKTMILLFDNIFKENILINCSIIHGDHDMETTKACISRELDKDVVHIYEGILLSQKTR